MLRVACLTTAALTLTAAGTALADCAHLSRADLGPYHAAHAGVIVDAGVTGRADVVSRGGHALVRIHADGLAAGAEYGAHVHVGRCADYLGHFRYDPAGLGTRDNEVWLDLRANPAGRAHDEAEVPALPSDQPLSVVVHEHSNPDHAEGEAGHPGARIACGDLTDLRSDRR